MSALFLNKKASWWLHWGQYILKSIQAGLVYSHCCWCFVIQILQVHQLYWACIALWLDSKFKMNYYELSHPNSGFHYLVRPVLFWTVVSFCTLVFPFGRRGKAGNKWAIYSQWIAVWVCILTNWIGNKLQHYHIWQWVSVKSGQSFLETRNLSFWCAEVTW